MRPAEIDDARRIATIEDRLRTYRNLARKDPETYLPKVAEMLLSRGISTPGEWEDPVKCEAARRDCAEGLQIYRQLVARDRSGYQVKLMEALRELGLIDWKLGRYEDARRECTECLQMCREMEVNFRQYVAEQLAILGEMSLEQGHLDDARAKFDEMLGLFRVLAAENTEVAYLQEQMAVALVNLGFIDGTQGRIEQAKTEYREAVQIYRDMAAKWPRMSWHLEAADTHLALTKLYIGTPPEFDSGGPGER